MKKVFSFLLVIAMTLTIIGCSTEKNGKKEVVEYPNRIEGVLVNDFAGVLSAETKEEILDAGKRMEDKIKGQVVVVSVETLDGKSVEKYAKGLSKQWGITDANGTINALLLVSKEEREVHISLGYGWDELITDEEIDEILDTYAVSYIKNGNLNDGIKESYLALVSKMYKELSEALMSGDKGTNVITVPNFVGMTVEQIANNPEYLEWFKFNDYIYEYSTQPEGTVIAQSLEAGISVKKGVHDITLRISRGPRMQQVPNVIGLHRDSANIILENAGFVVAYRFVANEDVAAGYVIALEPDDATLPYGSEIMLAVSCG